jgi:hypothetical protein
MTKKILWIVPLVMLLGSTLYAQDIVGDWQGTLAVRNGLRAVLQIRKGDNEGWKAVLYTIDLIVDRNDENNRQRWAGSHQSPAAWDPRWMGLNIVVTGTVSRVDVDSTKSPQWVTIYFKESPDATFVVCSPYPDLFQEKVGLNLSALVGKTLGAAGQVESPYCGHNVPKGSIRVVETKQWQLH